MLLAPLVLVPLALLARHAEPPPAAEPPAQPPSAWSFPDALSHAYVQSVEQTVSGDGALVGSSNATHTIEFSHAFANDAASPARAVLTQTITRLASKGSIAGTDFSLDTAASAPDPASPQAIADRALRLLLNRPLTAILAPDGTPSDIKGTSDVWADLRDTAKAQPAVAAVLDQFASLASPDAAARTIAATYRVLPPKDATARTWTTTATTPLPGLGTLSSTTTHTIAAAEPEHWRITTSSAFAFAPDEASAIGKSLIVRLADSSAVGELLVNPGEARIVRAESTVTLSLTFTPRQQGATPSTQKVVTRTTLRPATDPPKP
jgi:hypothetical protein